MRQVERLPLWDQAYAELRIAMLGGRFGPGERILLREVAAELGISLTPVRDAVNRLIAEHVLERGSSGQGGGAVVPRMDVVRFDELLTIRCDLEGRAAARAAERCASGDLGVLDELLAEMKALIRAQNLNVYLDLHRRFHFELYALARMPILEGLIENIWLRCGPVLTYVIPDYVLLEKGSDLHTAALSALRAGDADAAATAIRQDIREAGRYIVGLADAAGLIENPAVCHRPQAHAAS
ncbi:GntR family transcriptional regulator [Methylobacterium sp. J-026]|uniref:GntR family transcriptional regulator n=1 Tax=Methylobacterium sp. J-026 TaxID=2836624 RepID=UPI00244520DC|nr:GntR family transcriptional regulator [Methylobacterium sp. J-026]MCJ2137475.1 GntR family transcriptional regulator [Methylobacterium sp. J-026]